jgi:hypothetical protein
MHHATDLTCSETLVEHEDLTPDARLDARGTSTGGRDGAAAVRWHAHGTQPTEERGPLEGGTDARFAKWRGGQRMRTFLSFEAARAIVRKARLRSRQEWRTWSKSEQRPSNVPGCPHVMYKDAGWISEQDWLGYSSVRTASRTASPVQDRLGYSSVRRTASRAASRSSMVPFAEAREFVWKLKLRSRREWRAWCKGGNRPSNIPAAPRHTYRNKGWISTSDWLGYTSKRKRRGTPRRPRVRRQSSPTGPPDAIASVWPGDASPGFTGGHQHGSITACVAEGKGDRNDRAADLHWRNVELEMDSRRTDLVLTEFTLALSETMDDISS